MRPRPILLCLVAVGLAAPLAAERFTVDPARSVVAVLTHKAGFAGGFAHNHLITVPVPVAEFAFDPAAPEATRWQGRLAVERLEFDPPAARAAWQGRLRELGALTGGLGPVDDDERRKIRSAGLDAGQLDAARFPELAAEVLGVERRQGAAGSPFLWAVRFRLTLHGRTVERHMPATWRLDGDALAVEILGEYRFSEFGIEPYSAFLGAVKNEDRFHLFVALAAAAPPPETSGDRPPPD